MKNTTDSPNVGEQDNIDVDSASPLVGQQYQEKHSRNIRVVEIIGREGDYVTLKTVRLRNSEGKEMCVAGYRNTKAHANRFVGKKPGYFRTY